MFGWIRRLFEKPRFNQQELPLTTRIIRVLMYQGRADAYDLSNQVGETSDEVLAELKLLHYTEVVKTCKDQKHQRDARPEMVAYELW